MNADDTRHNTSLTTIGDAQEILQHHLECLWDDPSNAGEIPPLMLWGPPGIGKSTIIRELTEELDIGFIDVRLAQREPVDIRGLPVPSFMSLFFFPFTLKVNLKKGKRVNRCKKFAKSRFCMTETREDRAKPTW